MEGRDKGKNNKHLISKKGEGGRRTHPVRRVRRSSALQNMKRKEEEDGSPSLILERRGGSNLVMQEGAASPA